MGGMPRTSVIRAWLSWRLAAEMPIERGRPWRSKMRGIFHPFLAAVGRIRSRQLPPLRARTLTESIAHHDQSSSPREPSSSRTRRWSLAHTLARDHRRSHRG
ncbi:hypothetical protein BIV25_28730 [Streptomyces sp. MUSC 14]|nr:hypothetical protein BIV25_28730 [Streptomyces sp. MUSC 14]